MTLGDGTALECRPALQVLKSSRRPPAGAVTAHHDRSRCRSQEGRPSIRARKTVQLLHVGGPRTRQRRYANQPSSLLLLRAHRSVRSARQQCDLRHHTHQSHQRARTSAKTKSRITPRYRETSPGPPRRSRPRATGTRYDAILTGEPYPIKAIVSFGSDPLLTWRSATRQGGVEALESYTHVDTTINPSAAFADLLLPASTCWEHEALLPFSEIAEDTMNWAQLRPAVANPVGESRSDIDIIFALAQRLDLTKQFFGVDLEAGFAYQMAPSQLSVQQLRRSPVGLRANVTTRHRKYREIDAHTGEPQGFDTPTRKIEIYSTAFANAGYAPLPFFETNAHADPNERYPLTLSFYRLVQFCDEQHRNIARLRRAVPEPFLEIHPQAAGAQNIRNGEWVSLETKIGKVRLKAKFNDSLHPDVVATVYGWWQACGELKLNGHDPFAQNGANANLLIPNSHVDPISASVAHRGQRCRVRKAKSN